LSRLDYRRAGFPSVFHDRIDFLPAAHVVADGQLCRTALGLGNACIVREIVTWPDGQLQSRLQVEKCDGTMLEFFADDAFRWQPKTVAIELKRSFQIVHSERYH
jgi:hypothetical protein